MRIARKPFLIENLTRRFSGHLKLHWHTLHTENQHTLRLLQLRARHNPEHLEFPRDLLQYDAYFQAREWRSEAEMDAVPEGLVPIGTTPNIKMLRLGKVALIEIRGEAIHLHILALAHQLAAYLDIRFRHTPQHQAIGSGPERRHVADDLLYG